MPANVQKTYATSFCSWEQQSVEPLFLEFRQNLCKNSYFLNYYNQLKHVLMISVKRKLLNFLNDL